MILSQYFIPDKLTITFLDDLELYLIVGRREDGKGRRTSTEFPGRPYSLPTPPVTPLGGALRRETSYRKL